VLPSFDQNRNFSRRDGQFGEHDIELDCLKLMNSNGRLSWNGYQEALCLVTAFLGHVDWNGRVLRQLADPNLLLLLEDSAVSTRENESSSCVVGNFDRGLSSAEAMVRASSATLKIPPWQRSYTSLSMSKTGLWIQN
jgi:hypothetical protein